LLVAADHVTIPTTLYRLCSFLGVLPLFHHRRRFGLEKVD